MLKRKFDTYELDENHSVQIQMHKLENSTEIR